MAGGEKAKSSGEYGEKIVKNLLSLIGWDNLLSNITIPCKNERHEAEKHGADFIFQYKCPLRDSQRQDIIVSVKCREGYPKTADTIKKRFKEFVLDLALTMECYPASSEYLNKIPNTTKRNIHGIIFWIDRDKNDGKEYNSVVDSIGSFAFREECTYNSISLIDNKRAQNIYELVNFAKNTYGQNNVEFFYINTGLNNASLERIYKGNKMPLEYLTSNVIPLAINDNNQNILFLACLDAYEENQFKRLIGLAQNLTSNWASKVVIAYTNYDDFENKTSVTNAKATFDDSALTKNIEVITFKPDFRDEV